MDRRSIPTNKTKHEYKDLQAGKTYKFQVYFKHHISSTANYFVSMLIIITVIGLLVFLFFALIYKRTKYRIDRSTVNKVEWLWIPLEFFVMFLLALCTVRKHPTQTVASLLISVLMFAGSHNQHPPLSMTEERMLEDGKGYNQLSLRRTPLNSFGTRHLVSVL